jgi:mono/diheme cytochrome c family protein
MRGKFTLILTTLTLVGLTGAGAAQAETALERGRYLVQGPVGCGNCHTPRGTDGQFLPDMELAGGMVFDEAPAFKAIAPNITPDPETGMGNWTDAQLILAIREGKRPDGRLIGPPMPVPLYRDLADSDIKAIIAYLRTVKPVKHPVEKSAYNIPLPLAYGPPVGAVPDVPRDDKVAYGAYIAGPLAHCVECHTPHDAKGMPIMDKLFAGGFPLNGPWGTTISTNLTPDAETGIGTWSDAEIKQAITHGVRKDGTRLAPPMGFSFYANISEQDLDAIVAFLHTLKPIANRVR